MGELGALLLSDVSNGSSWADSLTLDAALLYPFSDDAAGTSMPRGLRTGGAFLPCGIAWP